MFDTIETNNHVNIIMEYIPGNSLHGYLKQQANRRLSENDAINIFRQIVSSIEYCHSKQICHRDIKLENILLDENNNPKLIDFGFSTCIPNDKKYKMFCGTPSYMAPEIINKQEYCGPPADIWALGVLLYALLNGTFPFKGQTDKELYKKITKGEFVCCESITKEADEFLKWILNVESDKRPTANFNPCMDVKQK
ncbi:protein kinase domain protein [Ichthyophthirius multifiliis]|uniref:Protein kinase domain protein n=1 Tax=Ichthyophthirius multifiliis TaxID=5932 RepID=G0QUY8_ICHMU|nr:protein kinase domain protein [Ichthyophthirius multifiliis]EGR30993.1 protein kinase domain protein [Ichthyophthirius multifiliis]|eukprot:XP_004034479.1 protein kinase domain protein [Ichthyophthirius multifiliis]